MIDPHSDQSSVICDSCLSRAWGRVLMRMFNERTSKLSPLLICVSDFGSDGYPIEDSGVRSALDEVLSKSPKFQSVENSAFTIFPEMLWIFAEGDRAKFYDLCSDFFPRMKKMHRANQHGIYFERLIAFDPKAPCEGNQLEMMINGYRTGRRASYYQAAVFDPIRDHSEAWLRGFPCLQHISLIPGDNGLVLNAFYATQFLISRAYGNLLGLSHLGRFMAEQFGTSLSGVNMMIGVESLELPKKNLQQVRSAVEAIL